MSKNKNTKVFTTIGASNHSQLKREENDYYATHSDITKSLLKVESFNKNILEPACGEGHISQVLKDNGYNVESYDLINRGYGEVKDFFSIKSYNGDIITNPPYGAANDFVAHALDIVNDGSKVAMMCRTLFLESVKRYELFKKYPIKTVYIFSRRQLCSKNGEFEKYKARAISYSWFVWEKGFKNDTVIKFIND